MAIRCLPTSPGAGHRGALMSRAPTTTSVQPAIFRRVGIAGPPSSTTWTTASSKLACTAAVHSATAVMSKPSVGRTIQRPISTLRWKSSNRSNRQPTINHEQFATPSSNLTACALPQVLAQVEPEDAFQATGFAYDYLQQADEMRRRLSCRATF